MACVIISNSCHARFGKVDALYWLDCCGILYVCGHMLESIQSFLTTMVFILYIYDFVLKK